jgi:hypothetical protein
MDRFPGTSIADDRAAEAADECPYLLALERIEAARNKAAERILAAVRELVETTRNEHDKVTTGIAICDNYFNFSVDCINEQLDELIFNARNQIDQAKGE